MHPICFASPCFLSFLFPSNMSSIHYYFIPSLTSGQCQYQQQLTVFNHTVGRFSRASDHQGQLPGALRFPGSFHGMAELPTCNIPKNTEASIMPVHQPNSRQCSTSVVNNALLSQIDLRIRIRFCQSRYPTNLSLRHVLRGTTKPRLLVCPASTSRVPSHHDQQDDAI
ncbi:uncharacterized protein LY79DRAFT_397305 [Colletotrichum navitas]|uniref:Uncharacterized protein n=1 Tax=Colletotrichum navitas TaxID=681940 RepID=A0AAD8PP56_9PEZI|nr:uncharacterized protein LY79DRAFT_397305 [Colletotrichum navitas]KAK1573804.1 hypothetical protein LY79DRAFT_397305 [Colletotrichum navitas]